MDWITGAKVQIIFDIAKLFWCKSNVLPSVWVRYPIGVHILTVSLSCDYLPIILRLWCDTDNGMVAELSRSSLGKRRQGIREEKKTGNLKICDNSQSDTVPPTSFEMGGSA